MQQACKKLFTIVIAMCIHSQVLQAKDAPQYAVDLIPTELTKDANAVVRINDVVFEIFSDTKAKETTKYAVTILKEGAIDMAILNLNYDKLFKVSSIVGNIYDANGKKVRKIKNDEIRDISAISGSTLFSDNRRKYIDPDYYAYPFTIEYSYITEYNTLFFMPNWVAFDGYNVSTQHSKLTAIVDNSYTLRFLEKNIKVKESQSEDNKTIYEWMASDVAATNYEILSPNIFENVPSARLAATSFKMDGINGSLNSWNDMGVFMNKLIADRDILPEETINELKQLTANAESKEEKIKILYEYSQKKNRYISIQEGVGGWQPFPAETVDRLSYGDCKALSNYTKSLLKAVGIESYYARIYAGQNIYSAPKDFSINTFNHVILCVPCDTDTIWLECTSSDSPLGYMSDFTDDRYALLVKENGGELIKTPHYTAEQNRQNTNCTISFTDNFNLDIDAKISYSGANYGDEYYLLHRDEKDRRKTIINRIDIPNFKLINYHLEDDNDRTPVFTKNLQLEASNYCSQMGQRKLLKLNLLNSFNGVPNYARKRRNPVRIQRNYSECDTIKYQLPSDISVEALPKKTELDTKYGIYKSSAEVVDGDIIYYRYFQINKGEYPKEEFNDFRDFLEKVSSADNAKTVLIPKA
ncbi:DUF3857 domain-containing transglutaminase family protein [Carboxylicivirga sp. M1479]|uniref:DUF3857 domain-containing protein n=1 Tax=Carboxylicivirga sp. M1479 TaxID=2594476 RepID=UPI0011788E19|nr:DUF3857 domain-containing transglutaminase family protein [Carboxylicivirga sp. M1479]TRX63269.1 DUF3857 domain-containing protein [Carboxylicivirga sp. M1479]